jgi:predicted HTH domain antitoxin
VAAGTAAVGRATGATAADGRADKQSTTVATLTARSPRDALISELNPAVDAHSSVTVARMIDERRRPRRRLSRRRGAVRTLTVDPVVLRVHQHAVLAHEPETEGRQQLAETESGHRYEPMVDGEETPGQTNLNRDPPGCRTRFVLAAAVALYERERITLGDAARLAGVDRWTMREILREHGVELRLGLADEDDAAYEVEAVSELEFDNEDSSGDFTWFVYRHTIYRRLTHRITP